MKNSIFSIDFWDIYGLSLLISVKAFLPSLRVLKISQDREEMITIVSVNREIKVGLILFNKLLKFFLKF